MHKLSVIINSYKSDQALLSDAIDSILNQKGVEVKCIVSTVHKDPAIETSKKKGVTLVLNKKPNIYGQINNALSSVWGDWFFYFSGNDIAAPNKSLDEINMCLRHNKRICYSSFYKTNSSLKNKKLIKFHDYSLKKHYSGNFVSDVSMIRVNLLKKHSPFDVSVGNAAFWDFWLRIAEKNPNEFIYNKEPTWMYRVESTSRHILRKSNKVKVLENYKQKRNMLKKHSSYLRKYNLYSELKNLEASISRLRKEIANDR